MPEQHRWGQGDSSTKNFHLDATSHFEAISYKIAPDELAGMVPFRRVLETTL